MDGIGPSDDEQPVTHVPESDLNDELPRRACRWSARPERVRYRSRARRRSTTSAGESVRHRRVAAEVAGYGSADEQPNLRVRRWFRSRGANG